MKDRIAVFTQEAVGSKRDLFAGSQYLIGVFLSFHIDAPMIFN
jgi:hypothetical protein